MTRPADAENLAVKSAEMMRSRDQETVYSFADAIRLQGPAYAIRWDATEAIIAEARLAVAVRFIEFWADNEMTEKEALEFLAYSRDEAMRQIGYFDPTNQSSSSSTVFVEGAKFKACRAIIEFVDGLLNVRDEWV